MPGFVVFKAMERFIEQDSENYLSRTANTFKMALLCTSLLFWLIICLISGCGGGSGSGSSGGGSASSGKGSISMVLPFPAEGSAPFEIRIMGDVGNVSRVRSRGEIPSDLASYVIDVYERGTSNSVISSVTAHRPSSGDTSIVTISDLPIGWKTLWLNAYNENSMLIGSGSVEVEVLSGTNTPTVSVNVKPSHTLAGITVDPSSATVLSGDTVQFTATGRYRDGAIEDLTSQVLWNCDDGGAGSMGSGGLFTAAPSGTFPVTASVTATLDTITSEAATVTITAGDITPGLESITIAPPETTLSPSETQQYSAVGTYSDKSTVDLTGQATWICDTGSAGNIDSSGLFTAAASGSGPQTAHIWALFGDITSNRASITVSMATPAYLTSINISPISATFTPGGRRQYVAMGSYSDGSTRNISSEVTWECDNTLAGNIDTSGRFVASATGSFPLTANIVARSGNLTSNSAEATVNSAPGGDPNNGDWSTDTLSLYNTPEADIMARTGDIDNLRFGWPSGFDPFSGNNTPVHSFPWTPETSDPSGIDRIMVPSSYNGYPPHGRDGYTNTTSRPANSPRAITISYDLRETPVSAAIIYLFVDDFQAPVWWASYRVTLNGRRAPFLETVINSLSQTGPIGKMIYAQIPDNFLDLLATGNLEILIDDPTTGAGDGYAIDFVKILINPSTSKQTGTISGTVYDAASYQPVSGAQVSAGGVVVDTTDNDGNYLLTSVPAGLAAVTVTRTGYLVNTRTVNLPAGTNQILDFYIQGE